MYACMHASSLTPCLITHCRAVRACTGNINPNCVSTASLDGNYGPAWRATETDAAAAAKVLESAILGSERFDEAQPELLEATSLQYGEYRAFA